jgi:hypothetical protein
MGVFPLKGVPATFGPWGGPDSVALKAAHRVRPPAAGVKRRS